ncbi:MAG: transcription termination factor Rho [Acidimicrobiales bacterium]|nr:transcription termination factor Rho [Acidimicrobiales bacterium]
MGVVFASPQRPHRSGRRLQQRLTSRTGFAGWGRGSVWSALVVCGTTVGDPSVTSDSLPLRVGRNQISNHTSSDTGEAPVSAQSPDRATLEDKDRDELKVIAAALGAKVTSKTRKGEMIDLIMDRADAGPAPVSGDTTDREDSDEGDAGTPGDDDAGAEDEADGTDDETADGSDRGGRNRSRQASNDGSDRKNRDQPEAGNRRRRRRGRGGGDRDEGAEAWNGDPLPIVGHLDVRPDGYGFIRTQGWRQTPDDAYVSVKQVRAMGLRTGDHLVGTCRPANRNEKNASVLSIDEANGGDPADLTNRPDFDELTPLFPDVKLVQEIDGEPGNMTARMIDLLAPIGKGQRGMIVSPPKAGKTSVLKSIARSIETNNPEVHLIVLLVDERPEEVTDMQRWVRNGEVEASTFDRPPEEHIAVAEMTIERAKRLVEMGKDVAILVDGITRLTRAYNQVAPQSGRGAMSGGLDSSAIYPPKRFFGAARNVEEGGSLTILATALVETGSRMDDVIFEEFKGTGNMELRLDRKAAERRIYPAIDIEGSSTRQEELLFDRKELQQVWKLRRVLSALAAESDAKPAAALEMLSDRLVSFSTNKDFLAEVAKGPIG